MYPFAVFFLSFRLFPAAFPFYAVLFLRTIKLLWGGIKSLWLPIKTSLAFYKRKKEDLSSRQILSERELYVVVLVNI
jgi:hypothetical protein